MSDAEKAKRATPVKQSHKSLPKSEDAKEYRNARSNMVDHSLDAQTALLGAAVLALAAKIEGKPYSFDLYTPEGTKVTLDTDALIARVNEMLGRKVKRYGDVSARGNKSDQR